jgi:Kinesin motor domain
MSLDILFRSIGQNIRRPHHPDLPNYTDLLYALQASDASEAQIMSATTFLESIYGEGDRARMSRAQTPMSRAQTPMMVRNPELPGSFPVSPQAAYPQKVAFWERLSPQKSLAKSSLKETPIHHTTRRPPMPHLSALPNSPDVSTYSIDVDRNSDYVVLVSMYEVYNDRIFDLLSNGTPGIPAMTTRQGAALQKGLLRRPLLFKNTEMSPDRKVVAGLRKVVCSSYDEAMMVLETGLTERRVAGTGSNSVSSRSHGFFCIEVRKSTHMRHYWTGSTLSIVDLAGSERARNAKTTGSTLAEAGKINESLMYLGQCLQVQSDCQHDGSKPIVPFRQCKLTELLFSNSFPSSSNTGGGHRTPQKAVMVVTADPQGDFNATSQILRYSALAREVTVPRVPSVTSSIVGNGAKHGLHSGRSTPHEHYFSAQELEQATNEVARLTEECNALAVRLAQEEIMRTEAELKLQAAEERMLITEQDVREECWAEMEERMEEEKERWRRAWEEQRLRGERYVDGKLEILQNTCSPTKQNQRSPTKTKARY